MYILPQELEVWYVIPAIRRELSKCLVKNYGVSYGKVGEILGITKAAVSQYIKEKRATKVKLHEKALEEIRKSCGLIMAKKSYTKKEIMRLLSHIREKQLPCEVCDKKIQGVLEGCKEFKISYEL